MDLHAFHPFHPFADLGPFQGFGVDTFGLSLQDMIDTDLAGNLNHMEAFELWNDLDLDLELSGDDALKVSKTQANLRDGLNSSQEDLNGDCTVLVNPISVMPILPLRATATVTSKEEESPPSPTPKGPEKPVAIATPKPAIAVVAPKSTSQLLSVDPALASPRKKQHLSGSGGKETGFPKPAYSYSCLIALALKNSPTGSMMVSEIYKFMCKHFPYFKTAPSGWKNSVRHNLSLNKCFEKIEKPSTNGSQRKGCLWAMNPAKINKMEEEVSKWSKKDPVGIKKGMLIPDNLSALERGELVAEDGPGDQDSDDNDDPKTPTSVSSRGSKESDVTMEYSDVEMGSQESDDVIEVDAFDGLTELDLHDTSDIFEEYDVDSPGFFRATYSVVTTGVEHQAKEF